MQYEGTGSELNLLNKEGEGRTNEPQTTNPKPQTLPVIFAPS